MTDYLTLPFAGETKDHDLVDWHTFIMEVNRITSQGGAGRIFGGPEIRPATHDLSYAEIYPQARVELDGEGDSTARVVATSEHAASVFRIAAERLNLPITEPDPRQILIDALNDLWRANGWQQPTIGEIADAVLAVRA